LFNTYLNKHPFIWKQVSMTPVVRTRALNTSRGVGMNFG